MANQAGCVHVPGYFTHRAGQYATVIDVRRILLIERFADLGVKWHAGHVAAIGRNQMCATGSASASFRDRKTVIAIFNGTGRVAHEELVVKTSSYNVVSQVGPD